MSFEDFADALKLSKTERQFCQSSNALLVQRSQRTMDMLKDTTNYDTFSAEYLTEDEQFQVEVGTAFYKAVDELAVNPKQANELKNIINRYVTFMVRTVTEVVSGDVDYRHPSKEIIAENNETIAAQAQALKNMRSQLKAQETAATALEDMQRRERGLMLEMEAMKARLADMEKEKTKIQNTLAKTTIAYEKSQELLQKNAQINLKKIGKGK